MSMLSCEACFLASSDVSLGLSVTGASCASAGLCAAYGGGSRHQSPSDTCARRGRGTTQRQRLRPPTTSAVAVGTHALVGLSTEGRSFVFTVAQAISSAEAQTCAAAPTSGPRLQDRSTSWHSGLRRLVLVVSVSF
eukprot:6214428-Pleurochrysis_carterae.AAC.2